MIITSRDMQAQFRPISTVAANVFKLQAIYDTGKVKFSLVMINQIGIPHAGHVAAATNSGAQNKSMIWTLEMLDISSLRSTSNSSLSESESDSSE